MSKHSVPDVLSRAYLRTLAFAALLGVPVAFASVLFQTALHDLIHLVWEVVPAWLGWSQPPGWYVVLVPGIAGILVAAAVRLPGHGGHSPLEGVGMGAVHPLDLGSILLSALAGLGLGIVLGPEAPLIALGIGLATAAARLVRLDESEMQLLTFAGAFAAIASLFGSPLVTALLIFEVTAVGGKIQAAGLGRALLPGFVAAGTGALVFTGINDWPGLHQTPLALLELPAYETVRTVDIAWCLLVAVVVAAVVIAFRYLANAIGARAPFRPVATLAIAGLFVGALAVAFRQVADRPIDLVLFSGQNELPLVVAESSVGVLLLLIVAKGLAYAVSLGAGFRGGPIFPALVLGAAIGAVAAHILPGLETTPAVAAGIAAATTAVLPVPFTAVLLATLLVGSSAFDTAPIAVLAAAVGWLATTALPNPEDCTVAQAKNLPPPV